MDPEVAYQEMIEWAKSILDTTWEETDLYSCADAAEALAEHVQNLDAWLSKGGFPPTAWKRHLRQGEAAAQEEPRTADNFQRDDFEEFYTAYVETALWSSHDESDESGGEPMDANYTKDDIARECLQQMQQDCQKFFNQHYDLVEREIENETFRYGPDYGPWAHVGHDFWLTRNGHGAGFWDGDYSDDVGEILTEASQQFGEVDLYVGDDGQIYCSAG